MQNVDLNELKAALFAWIYSKDIKLVLILFFITNANSVLFQQLWTNPFSSPSFIKSFKDSSLVIRPWNHGWLANFEPKRNKKSLFSLFVFTTRNIRPRWKIDFVSMRLKANNYLLGIGEVVRLNCFSINQLVRQKCIKNLRNILIENVFIWRETAFSATFHATIENRHLLK